MLKTMCRPSHEGRGLKFPLRPALIQTRRASSLARGTWIEIKIMDSKGLATLGRPSHEGRGLKFVIGPCGVNERLMSSLARGTWIEIINLLSY